MKIKSFNEGLKFDSKQVQTKVIIETPFSKEIGILLKAGQLMKEHKAPYPILIHLLDGTIELGVQGKVMLMNTGDIITLEEGILHDLVAQTDSSIRLTLSKLDSVDRLKEVVERED
ncbi:cupin domain-containing protein [Paucihalobacter sp.]|uniref:cupin domain-containing protein n=1 Tax=Paucihalobacter sp. TaxID=2850405 RepID=UPI002FE2C415